MLVTSASIAEEGRNISRGWELQAGRRGGGSGEDENADGYLRSNLLTPYAQTLGFGLAFACWRTTRIAPGHRFTVLLD